MKYFCVKIQIKITLCKITVKLNEKAYLKLHEILISRDSLDLFYEVNLAPFFFNNQQLHFVGVHF